METDTVQVASPMYHVGTLIGSCKHCYQTIYATISFRPDEPPHVYEWYHQSTGKAKCPEKD